MTNISDVPQDDPAQPIASNSEDAATEGLKIRTRGQVDNLMGLAGATQVDINIDNLAENVNAANTALMQLGQPGESIDEIATRIKSDPQASPEYKARLSAAIASQSSYLYEVEAKAKLAEGWESGMMANDQQLLLDAYETDMTAFVNRTIRQHGVSKDMALKIASDKIEALGEASVVPNYANIKARIERKYAPAA